MPDSAIALAVGPVPRFLEHALACEQGVRREKSRIQQSFLRIGAYLRLARERELYRARGYETFREWVESPEVDLSHRQARDLVRIVEQLEPIVGAERLVGLGISKARALLPLVAADEGGRVVNAAEVAEAVADIEPLTTQDARDYVRDLRGRRRPPSQVARFSLRHRRQGERALVQVYVHAAGDWYPAGTLSVRAHHLEDLLEAFQARAEPAD